MAIMLMARTPQRIIFLVAICSKKTGILVIEDTTSFMDRQRGARRQVSLVCCSRPESGKSGHLRMRKTAALPGR